MPALKTLILAIGMFMALYLPAAAQPYSIRVEFNTNLRAGPSLEAAVLDSAPAGTVLEVIEQANRWLRIKRARETWMAGWVNHERVDAPAAGQAAAANTDNCCGIDRQCQSEQQWIDGYWAYQNRQCAPPATTPTSATAPSASPPATDNCCGIDRLCQSEQQWIDGYWAYQNRQCGPPAANLQPGADNCCALGWDCQHDYERTYGWWMFKHKRCTASYGAIPGFAIPPYVDHSRVRIVELSPGFTTMVNAGFELLRQHAPHWYAFAANGLNEIREVNEGSSGVYTDSGIAVFHHAPHSVSPYIRQDDYTMAEFLVHEACHVYQYREGRSIDGDLSWLIEYECELYAIQAAMELGGTSWNIAGSMVFLKDPTNRAHWWW